MGPYQYEGFFQGTLRTDYLNGKLQPQLTMIVDVSGIFGSSRRSPIA